MLNRVNRYGHTAKNNNIVAAFHVAFLSITKTNRLQYAH